MENKEKNLFPKGFFQKDRKNISSKKALKDVVPFEWIQKKNTNKYSKLISKKTLS